MKSLSDITASGFASGTSAFIASLPQHNTTPALALAQELAGNGFADAYNTFLGQGAGSLVSVGTASTVNGGRNVAIGFRAGEANTSGWQNTGIGFISLMKTTSGQYNTALGAYTLTENTTGSNNTGLGADALWKNTTGQANTAIGSYAGQQNITGANIVAIGVHALRYGTAASGSVAIGVEALRDTTGQDNTAVGVEAGRLNQGGQNNTIFGARAFWKSVTGNENVAFGPYALFNANGASRNIAIGFGALETLTTGFQNVSIGYFSGDALTDGENNTFIGNTAGSSTTTGDRNILIGHGIVASAAGASDEVNIGGVIKGNRATGKTNLIALEVAGAGFGSFAGFPVANNTVQNDENLWAARFGNAVAGSDYGLIYYVTDAGDVQFHVGQAGAATSPFLSIAANGALTILSPSPGDPIILDAPIQFLDATVQTTAAFGARGVTTVNFGAFPGASDASAAITGQTGILAGSRVRAWIEAKATANHTADEHWLESIDVMAGNVSAGAGFTIYAKNTGTLAEPVGEQWENTRLAGPGTGINQIRPDNGGGKATRLYGEFTVGWEWY